MDTKITVEQRASDMCENLKALSDYCIQALEAEHLSPDDLYPRNSYLNSLFIMSIAFSDGIVSLAQKGQLRAFTPLIRSLYETWINAKLIVATRSHVWAYHLMAHGETVRIEKLDRLLADGHTTAANHKVKVKEAKHIISLVKSRYKELPTIPGVVTTNRSLTRSLKLKQKCQILDYYRSLKTYLPSPTKSELMVTNYGWVYNHLSGTPHVDPLALNDLYERDAAGNWTVDVGGGQDRDYLIKLLHIAYMEQYELLRAWKYYLPVSDETIPQNLKDVFKNILDKKI
ncbi:MAG TPA: DUF5677 domain-containing protein [Verrucomicrobiae bacterium]|jgi:hypothetical protein|nr:DUF5677 domain-containing protein [Verrucomicrobiae bacterium]